MGKFQKLKKILIVAISIFCFVFMVSLIRNFKYHLETPSSDGSIEMPQNIESMGCIIDIEYIKYCPNILVAKYSVRTKDGSDLGIHMSWPDKSMSIDKNIWFDEYYVPDSGNRFVLDIQDKSRTISYGTTLGTKMIKKVSNDKYEFISLYAIGARNKVAMNNDDMTVKITIHDSKTPDNTKEIDTLYNVKKDSSCNDINSTIRLENLDFTAKSLGEFEFGKVLYFYIEDKDINNYELENPAITSDKYTLRFKDKNSFYDKDWGWTFAPRDHKMVEDFKASGNFKDDTKIMYINYVVIPNKELEEISEICLVNKETGVETLVYFK